MSLREKGDRVALLDTGGSALSQDFCDMFLVSTIGVLGRIGTTSFSWVENSSAVGVLDRNRKPDLGLMFPSSFFLNLFLLGLWLSMPRWMVIAASWPRGQSLRTWTTSL